MSAVDSSSIENLSTAEIKENAKTVPNSLTGDRRARPATNGSDARAGGITIRDAITADGVNYLLFQQGKNSKWVESLKFAYNDKAGSAELKASGMAVYGSKAMRELVEDIGGITDFRSQSVITQLGWTPPFFTLQDGSIIGPPGRDPDPLVRPQQQSRVRYRGYTHRWREGVARLFEGHPIGECILSATFAAPLMNLFGWTGTIGIGVEGASSTGKSTLQLAAASAYGPASDGIGHYRHTFNSTINALDQLMPLHRDSLLVIDELGFLDTPVTLKSAQSLYDFLMRFGSGDERRRYNDDTSNGIAHNFVFLTSANKSLATALAPLERANIEAASVRMSLIPVPDRPTGVWEYVPAGFASIQAVIDSLNTSMAANYGCASKSFLQRLVKTRFDDSQSLGTAVNNYYAEFMESSRSLCASGQDLRVARKFALIASAGQLAINKRVLPRGFRPKESALTCLELVLHQHHSSPKNDSIVNRLVDWLNTNDFYDLRSEPLPRLSTEELNERGAFVDTSVKGRLEVRLVKDVFHRVFPDYRTILNSPEANRIMIKKAPSFQTRRSVRQGFNPENVYCFTIPASSI